MKKKTAHSAMWSVWSAGSRRTGCGVGQAVEFFQEKWEEDQRTIIQLEQQPINTYYIYMI